MFSRPDQSRSPSPNPQVASCSTSTANTRQRSTRLQATPAEKKNPTPAAAQSTPSARRQASGLRRSTSTNPRAQGQATRKTDEAPRRLLFYPTRLCRVLLEHHYHTTPARRRRTQSSTSPLGEDIVSRDQLPERSETVAEKLSSTTHNNSLPTERAHPVNSSTYATTAHATIDSCSTKTVVDFGPEGVAPGLEPEGQYIDFGSLVPEGNKDKSGTIYLRFSDDGRSTTSLVVGGSKQCEVKLDGEALVSIFRNMSR